MFIINVPNKLILNIFNYFITLSDIIVLLIVISTVLTVKEVETEFNF